MVDQPVYQYLQNPVSVTRRYLPDYMQTFQGFMKAKEDLAQRMGLGENDDFPFYCTEEMLEEELQAIRQWSETKISPVSYEEANDAVVAAFAKYGVEGGLYPPEEGQAFFCTPVILDNTVRYIESVAQAQQQKETAGDGVYVNQ